jgi:hypothetical protein
LIRSIIVASPAPAVLRVVLGVELLARGVDVGRVDVVVDRVGRRLRLRERVVGGREHLGVDRRLDLGELRLGRVAAARRASAGSGHRVAARVLRPLLLGAVERLVVGERVRVRADDLGVHERRPRRARACATARHTAS